VKILIADDAPDIRFLARALLTVDGRVDIVGEAASATEAVEKASDLQPDVVILDQGFEGSLTGFEVAPRIKAAAPDIKIVLFTAYHGLKEDAESAPAIDAFLLKTDAHQLLAVITGLFAEKSS